MVAAGDGWVVTVDLKCPYNVFKILLVSLITYLFPSNCVLRKIASKSLQIL